MANNAKRNLLAPTHNGTKTSSNTAPHNLNISSKHRNMPFNTSTNATQTSPHPSSTHPTNPSAPSTLTAHIQTHLFHATTTEFTLQLRAYLLKRASHRLLAFWERHPLLHLPSISLMSPVPDVRLLAAAQAYVAHHAIDAKGDVKESFEASYKTGPQEKMHISGTDGREKFEVFEMVCVVGAGAEGVEGWEMRKLREEGRRVVERVVYADVKGFWEWATELSGEIERRLRVEAGRQGVEWTIGGELAGLRRTEEVERLLEESGVRVEVEARKRLRKVGIFGKVDAEGVRRAEGVKKAADDKSKGKEKAQKEQMRGRKRRSSDDMGFGGFRGVFQ